MRDDDELRDVEDQQKVKVVKAAVDIKELML